MPLKKNAAHSPPLQNANYSNNSNTAAPSNKFSITFNLFIRRSNRSQKAPQNRLKKRARINDHLRRVSNCRIKATNRGYIAQNHYLQHTALDKARQKPKKSHLVHELRSHYVPTSLARVIFPVKKKRPLHAQRSAAD